MERALGDWDWDRDWDWDWVGIAWRLGRLLWGGSDQWAGSHREVAGVSELAI